MKKYRAKGLLGLILVLLLTSTAGFSMAKAEEVQAAAEIPVSQTFKVYNTSGSNIEDKFEYIFASAEQGNPMPAGSSAEGYAFSMEGNESTVIPAISYVHAGVYKYTLKQVVTTEKTGYSYDMDIISIEVHVRNDGDGLRTDIVAYSNSDKIQSITFDNSYTAATNPPATGDGSKPAQTGQSSAIPQLTVVMLAAFFVLVLVWKRKKESKENT